MLEKLHISNIMKIEKINKRLQKSFGIGITIPLIIIVVIITLYLKIQSKKIKITLQETKEPNQEFVLSNADVGI